MTSDPDHDLEGMDRDVLLTEARTLRAAIREHRDSSGHDLCWHSPEMWALLPDTPPGGQEVPDWPQFMRGCIRYRHMLEAELKNAPRTDREIEE